MITNRLRFALATCTVVFLTTAYPALAQQAYTVQSIGTHSNGTYPHLMNDAGDVAGYHYPLGYQHAFVHRNGVLTDIGTLGGSYSWPMDINGSGVVVGYSYLTNDSRYHAFVFDGVIHDLGTLAGNNSQAYAINAAGEVVGWSDGSAFLYSGGIMRRLYDLLPAGSGWSQLYEAIDINDAGQIVGRGFHNSLGHRAFLFTPATATNPATIVTVGPTNTYPQWINASGQVAGREFSNGERVFLYTPGPGGGTYSVVPGLGGTHSYPFDLNDAGQIVGYSYLPGNTSYHAFLFSNGQTIDLHPSHGSDYSYARAINNSGVIVGHSNGPFVYANGTTRRINDLVNGCSWSAYDVFTVNNAGDIAGYGFQSSVGNRGFRMVPATSQTATSLTTFDVSGAYRRPIQLQARLVAACSAVANRTVSFAVNDTVRGSAQTDDTGWARLTTTLQDVVVGTYPDGIETSFQGDNDFDGSSDLGTLTVFRASPVISWTPAAIVEGTPLGPDQLNATADTAGNFFYSPAAGAILGAGLRSLFVSFQPSDTANYNSIGSQALLAVRASSPPFSFTATEIGGLGGTFMDLRALNNAGQAVGYWYLPGNSAHRAILFSNGVSIDLGTLGGQHSLAEDINDAGQVTGYSYTTNNSLLRAFLYTGGSMLDIGSLVPNGGHSTGRAINAAGDVALYARSATGYDHAFLYTAATGSMSDLGTLNAGQYSYPLDINASRQVVGYSYTTNGCYHAFLATTAGMQDLGTLGGSCSQAVAISDAGHVIGWANDAAGQQRAFLYKDGKMIDLGTLGGSFAVATAVNEQGVVTGWSYLANNSRIHAFRYANGVMTDLGALSFDSRGNDVNDAGDIAGWGHSTGGLQTAILHKSGTLYDVNALINVGETAGVNEARKINTPGQILARSSSSTTRWYVLTPTTLSSSSLSLSASAGVYRGTTSLTATLSIAEPAGALVSFKLNGTVLGTAFADANGVATLQGVSLGLLNVGTHVAAATASFAGNVEYAGSTAAADVVIAKATPTINWSQPAAITYGTLLSSTQLNATTTVAGQFTFAPAIGTLLSAGDHTLHVSFAPTDTTNYNQAEAQVNLTVLKATPSINWANPANIVYGALLGATQLNATSPIAGTFEYTPAAGTQLNAGTAQTLSVTFTPTDSANYNSANRSVVINVVKATPTLTWANPADIVYGTALGAAQLNATSPVPGAFSYSPVAGTVLNAGTGQTLNVVFTPTDTNNYNGATRSVPITVLRATPSVIWNNPADIVYGTPLGGAQLNASSPVAGTFTYAPAAGTLLNVGTAQTLSVNFTPNDTNNYTGASRNVAINVLKATPTITWPNPASIVYGTALGAAQLNATTAVAGSFVYSPIAGTVLNAGPHTLSVTFTPSDTTNYNGASKSVALTVNPAPLTITAENKSMVLNGSVPAFTAAYNGFVNGDTTANLSPAVILATTATGDTVGGFSITVSGGGNPNYAINRVAGTLTVLYATGACLGQAGHQVLDPLNADGSSVYKRNSTVPVKFRVCDANGNSIGASNVVAGFAMTQVLAGTVSQDLEVIESTTPDSAFRWDPTALQWIFNLSTKSQSANRTYVYRITLGDQSVIEFRYGLR